ncbi:MAG: hypothetical protein KIT27_05525 [Legionellales bacterium]|nr:hypothetical protein [Legionellales bacterium]
MKLGWYMIKVGLFFMIFLIGIKTLLPARHNPLLDEPQKTQKFIWGEVVHQIPAHYLGSIPLGDCGDIFSQQQRMTISTQQHVIISKCLNAFIWMANIANTEHRFANTILPQDFEDPIVWAQDFNE